MERDVGFEQNVGAVVRDPKEEGREHAQTNDQGDNAEYDSPDDGHASVVFVWVRAAVEGAVGCGVGCWVVCRNVRARLKTG